MLTDGQIAHFEVFGFARAPGLFSAAEADRLGHDLEEVLAEARGGQPFDGKSRQAVLGFVETHPAFRHLLEEDRLHACVEQLLGPDFVWMMSDGNLYVGDTFWHPDRGPFDTVPLLDADYDAFASIKVAFYLDPLTEETGALRVMPGSHRDPLRSELLNTVFEHRKDVERVTPFGVHQRELPAYTIETAPGDVLFFDHLLWHSSWGGRPGRRMFTLNFQHHPTTDEGLEWMKWYYQFNLNIVNQVRLEPLDRLYDDAFLYSDSPRIQRMVAALIEHGLT